MQLYDLRVVEAAGGFAAPDALIFPGNSVPIKRIQNRYPLNFASSVAGKKSLPPEGMGSAPMCLPKGKRSCPAPAMKCA